MKKFTGSTSWPGFQWLSSDSCTIAVCDRKDWQDLPSANESLSGNELRKAMQLTDTGEKWHYMSRRVFQRLFVANLCEWNGPLSELPLVHRQDSRPFSPLAPSICFSFTTSGSMAAAAASNSATVGIDMEVVRVIPDCLQLARRFFHSNETAALASAPAEVQSDAFIKLWSGKEACLKAFGTGIVVGPEIFQFAIYGKNIALAAVPASQSLADWSCRELCAPDGHVLFLATKRSSG